MKPSGASVLLPALVVVAGGLIGCGPTGRPPSPVLLISVDTLRADRLGCYGSSLGLTPNLDRLAGEGALLEQVIVPVPRTSQSIASLLTGLHPIHHGVRGLFEPLPGGSGTTIAEVLSRHGYRTAALTSNLVLRAGQGFERGFDLYDNPRARWEHNGARPMVEDALDWIDRQASPDRQTGATPGSAWFLWLHLLDPHWPYEPDPPFDSAGGVPGFEKRDTAGGPRTDTDGADERSHAMMIFGGGDDAAVDRLRRLYDGEVAATDAAIGALMDGLRSRDLLDGVIIVVTSDHGESLGEHGYYFAHGEYLYEQTLRVPTLFRAPGLVPAGRRLKRLVRNYDLMPTIIELAGLEPPTGMDGVSRAADLRADGTDPDSGAGPRAGTAGSDGVGTINESDAGREIFIESDRQLLRTGNPKRFLEGAAGSWRGLRDERWKLIRIPRPGDDLVEAYDLIEDPAESRDRSHDPKAPTQALAARLAQWEELDGGGGAGGTEAAGSTTGSPEGIGTEEMDALRALGYVNTP